MRYMLLMVIAASVVLGCARDPASPVLPPADDSVQFAATQSEGSWIDPHYLWGEWTLLINESHDNVDVVPRRQGRLHLNALKFLEDYCDDCLEITGINNNGDGTINLQVRISHPFPGHPEYIGFDVKGIIMFQGSHEFERDYYPKYPLWPQPFRASWRLLGDPEVMNADGYSFRWSPWHESDSDLPIFNYWPGKHSNGTPTANINAYLDFYTIEERHIFESGANSTRTYRIWLPPGPVVAGYAVDACWVPPTVTPVTDPVEDFPITANQPEAYHFHCVVNDGQPITLDNPCCSHPPSVYKARAEMDFWYLVPETFPDAFWVASWCPEFDFNKGGTPSIECDGPSNWRCLYPLSFYYKPDGHYQLIAFQWHVKSQSPTPIPYISVDLFEIEIDME